MAKPFRENPRLWVFLGAGGVGKTTLSAAFSMALAAEKGRKVGLLSIDPARRLRDVLGISELPESGINFDFGAQKGSLHIASFVASAALRRWVSEESFTDRERKDLLVNPFFLALCDRFISAGEPLAAARVAEWLNLELDDIVIDTSPGFHALDFFSKPQKVAAFLDGKMLTWLKRWQSDNRPGIASRLLHSGSKRILDGLGAISGLEMLHGFANFMLTLEQMLVTFSSRIELSCRWFFSDRTRVILVAAPRPDAALAVREMWDALSAMEISCGGIVVNRSLPSSLQSISSVDKLVRESSAKLAWSRYLQNQLIWQMRVTSDLMTLSDRVIQLPQLDGLDDFDSRYVRLLALGHRLLDLDVPAL